MAPLRDACYEALKTIKYPGLSRDIVSFGLINELTVEGKKAVVKIVLTTPDTSISKTLGGEIREVLHKVSGIDDVEVYAQHLPPKSPQIGGHGTPGVPAEPLVPGVKHIVAVASGKGGVGKSTVTVNLALAMAQLGYKVGIMDSDIYGPSLPMMVGIEEAPYVAEGKLVPHEKFGVRLMSIGFLIPTDQALIWRGPMVMGAVEQLLKDVHWGELDFLFVDMPPGTGDAQLTLSQKVKLSGAVIVTTPQNLALLDAKKGVAMFQKVEVPILGIVENMSYFHCPNCNTRTDIFSNGGGRREALRLGVPFLGEVPLNAGIREAGDNGEPVVVAQPESHTAEVFRNIAKSVANLCK
ncbi:MAG: Mrp/NBP35 family ATP-binding protein [bacterium]|nr:Mrp/NBP35 family ATP-binding protein [bacterium]